ncbi:Erp25 protein (plasmid) [Borreliella valaisiana VS116]|uniref:Erp25 protein n=1 Tax=Borreliella valaisiana VS116 TaxID=445987 RepID=C0R8C0_BORVA|nr:Erp25 protein [Borreliella valaisiana VS116]
MIITCKNYASSKDLKISVENAEQQVKGFLDTKKEELTEGIKKLGSEISSKVKEELMQADEQLAQGVNEYSELKEKGFEKK